MIESVGIVGSGSVAHAIAKQPIPPPGRGPTDRVLRRWRRGRRYGLRRVRRAAGVRPCVGGRAAQPRQIDV